jgi:hypothetical protein
MRAVLCRVDLTDTDPSEWEADGPAQILSAVFREQARVVVIDATIGGTRFLATDAARVLLRTFDPPAIVLTTPRRGQYLEQWASEIGCYDVLSLADAVSPAKIARTVALARAWKEGHGPRALAPVGHSSQHEGQPPRVRRAS